MFKTVAEDIKSMVSSSKQEIPHSLQHLLIHWSVIRILYSYSGTSNKVPSKKGTASLSWQGHLQFPQKCICNAFQLVLKRGQPPYTTAKMAGPMQSVLYSEVPLYCILC